MRNAAFMSRHGFFMDALINEHAGGRTHIERKKLRENLPRLLAQAGLDVRIHWATPREIPAMVERLARSGASQFIVGGGDGTLSTAAHRLVGTDTTLGVLPLGTLNHFAKDLGLPTTLDDAVAVLKLGHEAAVDVGEVNGRIFINNASLGAYVRATRHRNIYQNRLGMGKWPAMALAMLRVFLRLPVLTLHLEDEQNADVIRTTFVFLGNNAYLQEGLGGVERRSLMQGKLGLVTSRQLSRLGVFRIGLQILRGRFKDSRVLEQRLTEKVRIDFRKRRIRVALDGEIAKIATPLEFRIRPRALKIIAP